MINFKKELYTKEKCARYIDRYIKFIKYCDDKNRSLDIETMYTEKHHILPRSEFPEFIKNENNIIILTGKQHYIAHWMLAKALSSKNMWFAFNQMRRLGKTSILYEYAKIYISESISKANKGKKHTQEFKDNVSKRFKGKRPAKCSMTNKHFWADPNDNRFATGEIVDSAIGRRHTAATKRKIGKANKGKSYYSDQSGNVRMFYSDQVPAGFIPYINPSWYDSKCENTIWIFNEQTGDQLRIKKEDAIPIGYTKGRNPNKHTGWEEINNNITVIDLYIKKYINLPIDMFDNTRHYNINGVALNNTPILIHNNNLMIGYLDILGYCHSIKLMIRRDELKSGFIKDAHWNNEKDVYEFRKKYARMSLKDLFKIELINIKDFTMDEKYKIWRND